MSDVAVTQPDRDAAAAIYSLLGFGPCQHIIDGVEDDLGVVQIVAAHRLAALEEAARVAEAHRAPDGVPQIDYDAACDDIAAALRQSKEQSDD